MTQVLRALAVALVATALVLGLAWWLGGLGLGKANAAEAFLERLFGDAVHEAYQDLSEDYAALITLRELQRDREFYRSTFGELTGVGDVVEETEADDGAHLGLAVRFQKTDAVAHFDLLRENDTWRIADFYIAVPRSRVEQPQIADPQVFAGHIVSFWAAGSATEVWTQLDTPVRARTPRKTFEASAEAALAVLGEFEKVEETAFEQPEADRANLRYTVTFANGTRQAELDLRWKGSRWVITRFQLEGVD